MKPMISLAAGNIHSPLPYLAQLCSPDDLWHQGKVQRFAGQVQCWAFMTFQLAIGWYCPREIQQRLWQEVREHLPLGALISTDLSHWMACISFKQDGMVPMPKLCYM